MRPGDEWPTTGGWLTARYQDNPRNDNVIAVQGERMVENSHGRRALGQLVAGERLRPDQRPRSRRGERRGWIVERCKWQRVLRLQINRFGEGLGACIVRVHGTDRDRQAPRDDSRQNGEPPHAR